jgi:hypothetical protein
VEVTRKIKSIFGQLHGEKAAPTCAARSGCKERPNEEDTHVHERYKRLLGGGDAQKAKLPPGNIML